MGSDKNKAEPLDIIGKLLSIILFIVILSIPVSLGILWVRGEITLLNAVGFVIIFLGALGYWDVFRYFRTNKTYQSIPAIAIEGIAMGLTKIKGRVAPFPKEKLMTSPMGRKKCVYFLIEECDREGCSTVNEKRIKFYLKDRTGQVLVDPKWSSIGLKGQKFTSLKLIFREKIGKYKEPKLSAYEYLSNYTGYPKGKRPSFKNFKKKETGAALKFSSRERTYIERIIKPGDKLFIFGTAKDNPFVKETTAIKAVRDIMIQSGKKHIFDSYPPYFITHWPIKWGGTRPLPINWSGLISSIIMILVGVVMVSINLEFGPLI
ncbi:MAG: hypothetical protein ACE5J7_02780 [Candidatus Aenigmatarchaeota archaeon]